jgi:DNA-directed RNA polymerase subunit RPC12/RpoP
METARMYICADCGKKVYTMERLCNKNTVSFLIQQRYKKYYTDVRKEGEEGEGE